MNLFSLPHTISPCDTCGAQPFLQPVRSFSTTRSIALRWKAHHRAQAAVKGFASPKPVQNIHGVLPHPYGSGTFSLILLMKMI